MHLTLAKSQGYLRNQLRQSGSSDPSRKLLAVIGVYTGFGSRLKRNVFRGSWMPKGQSRFRYYSIGVSKLNTFPSFISNDCDCTSFFQRSKIFVLTIFLFQIYNN